jgi:hypothetical protein
MPEAVLSILQRVYSPNRFPALMIGTLGPGYLERKTGGDQKRGWRKEFIVLRLDWLGRLDRSVWHDECDLGICVQPVHEEVQVLLINEEAK